MGLQYTFWGKLLSYSFLEETVLLLHIVIICLEGTFVTACYKSATVQICILMHSCPILGRIWKCLFVILLSTICSSMCSAKYTTTTTTSNSLTALFCRLTFAEAFVPCIARLMFAANIKFVFCFIVVLLWRLQPDERCFSTTTYRQGR